MARVLVFSLQARVQSSVLSLEGEHFHSYPLMRLYVNRHSHSIIVKRC